MSVPPPPGPHQPPRGPYPPPAPAPAHGSWGPLPDSRPAAVNGVAVAALVLGALCFVPALGLVLGVIALWQIRRSGERGRGMAIAGAALSALGLALWTASLATGFASDMWENLKDGARAAGDPLTLDKGDCFDSPDGLEGVTYDVDPVPCLGQHDGEVFAVITLRDGAYPGDDRLTEIADDTCYTRQDAYAMDPWAVPGNVDVYYFLPTTDTWSLGDREITCLFGNTHETGALTGSLRRDRTTLDGHQVTYLKAARYQDLAMAAGPGEEDVEDDLPGHRRWADDMAAAIRRQVRTLRAHDWPSTARRPVAGLVEDLEKARGEWLAAAAADDADTFTEHYGAALELTGPARAVTTREALGLATTAPTHAESGGDTGEGPGLDV
ncbi:DUF4190 domain-containing protein [Streptomyces sp. NPDC005925]|uniref:DUF4190 domain-containing protein n=1 Tax=Streptomyces sp. NPDC005925 TaxID=3157172 RepID=UPI00340F8FC9